MSSVNKAILIGNLGSDPEVRYTQSGQAVANFSLATNEVWNDQQGQKQQRTEWHKIQVWGKTAENCAKFLAKGRPVYIEGRITTPQWTDKEGQQRYTTEIVASQVQFLGGGKDAGGNGGAGGGQREFGGGSGGGYGSAPSAPVPDGFNDDDIPF
jgi:single-strand DNA-binding protein